jgi:hypothetical protein
MVEPGPPIRRGDCREPIKIADRALEPDRRRVEFSDRGKFAVAKRRRDHARPLRLRGADRHVDLVLVGPQPHEIAAAIVQRLADRHPLPVVHVVARPRPVAGHRLLIFKQSDERVCHRHHPSCAATAWNQRTTGSGSHTPTISTIAR